MLCSGWITTQAPILIAPAIYTCIPAGHRRRVALCHRHFNWAKHCHDLLGDAHIDEAIGEVVAEFVDGAGRRDIGDHGAETGILFACRVEGLGEIDSHDVTSASASIAGLYSCGAALRRKSNSLPSSFQRMHGSQELSGRTHPVQVSEIQITEICKTIPYGGH
jgi:hypothetical protein